MVSSGTAKGHTDLDGPLFHRNGTKGDGASFSYELKSKLHVRSAELIAFYLPSLLSSDSDSDSELSVDEHSSSYNSSHSSDSEEDDINVKPKWNNERQPVHSTPKGMWVVLSSLSLRQSQW